MSAMWLSVKKVGDPCPKLFFDKSSYLKPYFKANLDILAQTKAATLEKKKYSLSRELKYS